LTTRETPAGRPGRHDEQAEQRDDPAVEQPQAFLLALRTAMGSDNITEEKQS
jgi:hypothetical protein